MKNYERRIGTRQVMGTDWPVDLIVTGSGRKWTLAERCNGTCRWTQEYGSKAEAVAAAEEHETIEERVQRFRAEE